MTQLPCKKSEVEFIVWKDALSQWTRGEREAAADMQLATNITLGWPLHENDERIVFCNGTSTSGEMDHMIIPTASIVRRIKLRAR